MKGWYAGAQAGYSTGKVKLESSTFSFGGFGLNDVETVSSETNFSALKFGAKGGYQWVWNSGFSLDLNLGLAYNSFSYDDESGNFSTLKGSGILPNLGFGLGYAF